MVNVAEFFITVVTAGTFLMTLGTERYNWQVIDMLLAGDVVAASLAALSVQKVTSRDTVDRVVGMALILYNVRTLLVTVF